MSKRSASPEKRSLAKEILADAAKTKPDPKAFQRAAQYTTNAKASKRFGVRLRTPDGYPLFRFRAEGDTITGIVGKCNGQMGYGQSTYPLVMDDGSIVCIVGHRRLVKALHKAKAWNQRVKITFEGRLYSSWRHYEMVYAVELAPFQDEPMPAAGRQLLAKAAADAKARKAVGK